MFLILFLYIIVLFCYFVFDVIYFGRLLLKMRNNNGLGIVCFFEVYCFYFYFFWLVDVELFSMICCDWLVRKVFIYLWVVYWMLLNLNLLIIKCWCGIILKIFEKYRMIKFCFFLFMDFVSLRIKVISCVLYFCLLCW